MRLAVVAAQHERVVRVAVGVAAPEQADRARPRTRRRRASRRNRATPASRARPARARPMPTPAPRAARRWPSRRSSTTLRRRSARRLGVGGREVGARSVLEREVPADGGRAEHLGGLVVAGAGEDHAMLQRRLPDRSGALDDHAPGTGALVERRTHRGRGLDRLDDRLLGGLRVGDARRQLHHREDPLRQHPRPLHLLELGRGERLGPCRASDPPIADDGSPSLNTTTSSAPGLEWYRRSMQGRDRAVASP